MAGGTLSQVDQTAFAYQEVLRHVRKCSEVTNGPRPATLDRRVGLCLRRYRQKASQSRRLSLPLATDLVTHLVREEAYPASLCRQQLHFRTGHHPLPFESIRVLTG